MQTASGGGCINSSTDIPNSFCALGTAVSSINGPNSDSIGAVEMNPGDTEVVVIYATEQISQIGVDLQDVALFAGNQAPVEQLLGPVNPSTVTSSGVAIYSNNTGVLFFSRGPVQTAPESNGSAGKVELVTHLTVTNPTTQSAQVDPGTVTLTFPSSDLAAFAPTNPAVECGKSNGAPSDGTCMVESLSVPTSASTTVPAGGSLTIEIDGHDWAGFGSGGFSASAPVQDVKALYLGSTPGSDPIEIPQR